jgi:hypothetical protein
MHSDTLFDVYVCQDCGFFLANGEPGVHEENWSPIKS